MERRFPDESEVKVWISFRQLFLEIPKKKGEDGEESIKNSGETFRANEIFREVQFGGTPSFPEKILIYS